MLDVIDRCRQHALKRGGEATGHLIRRQPGVLPDHGDHRNSDVGKDVDGRAQRGERTDDHNGQREHHERVRALQCNTDDSDHTAGISLAAARASRCIAIRRTVILSNFRLFCSQMRFRPSTRCGARRFTGIICTLRERLPRSAKSCRWASTRHAASNSIPRSHASAERLVSGADSRKQPNPFQVTITSSARPSMVEIVSPGAVD